MDKALFNSLLMGTGRAPIPRANIQRPVLQAFSPSGGGYLPTGARLRPEDPSRLALARAAASALGMESPVTGAPRTDPMLARVQRGEFMPAAQRLAMQGIGLAGGTGAPSAGDGVSEEPTSFGAAMRSPLTSPTGRAITGASLAGLAAGGWSPTPVTFGQGIASMGEAAQKGYLEGKEAELKEAQRKAAADKAAFDRRLAIAQYEQKEREIGGVKGKEAFGNEKQLRSEFDKQAKVFDEAVLGFEKVQKAAMTETPTGATDIALIFGYMKVIDPTSVVREGEFATAENAGGIGSKLRNTYNKIVKGERLAPDVRQDFVRAARTQFMPYLDMQKKVEDRYSNLSEAYGLDASKVVLSRLPKTGTLARPYTSFATQADAEAANLPKGTYVMIGNQLFIED
jgi:hypothetical protein